MYKHRRVRLCLLLILGLKVILKIRLQLAAWLAGAEISITFFNLKERGILLDIFGYQKHVLYKKYKKDANGKAAKELVGSFRIIILFILFQIFSFIAIGQEIGIKGEIKGVLYTGLMLFLAFWVYATEEKKILILGYLKGKMSYKVLLSDTLYR